MTDLSSPCLPLERIRARLDALMEKKDYPGAERLLDYWLEEAGRSGDKRGEMSLRGEKIGFLRKTGAKEQALREVDLALSLLEETGMDGTLTGGTLRINAATALNAFGENERALALFEKANADLLAGAAPPPALLGGLYNNMGLCCAALGRNTEALGCFDRAMEQMGKCENGALEQAVTCLNRADVLEKELGPEEAEPLLTPLLEEAGALLDRPGLPRDAYYAFVCEKCAPVFDYYGFFRTAQALRARAEAIHERA